MKTKNSTRILLISAFFFLMGWMLFSDPIFSTDTATHNYISKKWFMGYIKNFYFPLWNSSLYGGIYNGASTVSGIYSPEILFYLFLNSYMAKHLSFALMMGLAAFGSYKLLKYRGYSSELRLLFAIMYCLSGYSLSMSINYVFFAGLCLLPLAASFFEKYRALRTRGSATAFTLLSAWILLVGDIYSFLTLIIYLFISYLQERSEGRFYLRTSFLIFLSLLISMVNYLPGFDVLAYSSRAGGLDDLAQASFFSIHPKTLIQFFNPEVYGFYGDGSFRGEHLIERDFPFPKRFWIDSLYFGLLPFLIFVAGLFHLGTIKKNILLYIATFVSLIICLGNHAFLHEILFKLPVYSSLRFPSKFFTITNLFFLLIVVMNLKGFEKILRDKISFLKNDHHYKKIILILCGIIFFDLFFRAPPLLRLNWKNVEAMEAQREVRDMLKKVQQPGTQNIKLLWDRNLHKYAKTPNNFKANWGIFHGVDYTYGFEPTITNDMEKINGSEVFQDFLFWRKILGINYVLTMASPQELNLAKLAQENLVHPIALDSKNNMVLIKAGKHLSKFQLFQNVKFVKDFDLGEMKNDQGNTLFIKGEGEDKLGNDSPGSMFEPSSDLPNEKRASFNLTSSENKNGSYLLYRQQFHRGWKAFVNGEETKIYKAHYLNMAIKLPEDLNGKKVEIVFKFSPLSFYVGLFLTFLGLILLFFFNGYQDIFSRNKLKNPVEEKI